MSTIKVRDGAAVWREIDGETILLALRASAYLGLNQTGTILWEAMVGGATAADLTDLLVERFDIDRGHATSDVAAFVEGCRAHGLLE